jgi:hypothetical protein
MGKGPAESPENGLRGALCCGAQERGLRRSDQGNLEGVAGILWFKTQE